MEILVLKINRSPLPEPPAPFSFLGLSDHSINQQPSEFEDHFSLIFLLRHFVIPGYSWSPSYKARKINEDLPQGVLGVTYFIQSKQKGSEQYHEDYLHKSQDDIGNIT